MARTETSIAASNERRAAQQDREAQHARNRAAIAMTLAARAEGIGDLLAADAHLARAARAQRSVARYERNAQRLRLAALERDADAHIARLARNALAHSMPARAPRAGQAGTGA